MEFEIVFDNQEITLEVFLRLIKRLKSQGFIESDNVSVELDVRVFKSNLRITVEGEDEIQNFCKTNTLDSELCVKRTYKSNFKFSEQEKKALEGDNVKNIKEKWRSEEYNFRSNLKKEYNWDPESDRYTNVEDVNEIILAEEEKYFNASKFKSENKTFRYKKRYSYLTRDGNFRVDITVVRQSEQYLNTETGHVMLKPAKSLFLKNIRK